MLCSNFFPYHLQGGPRPGLRGLWAGFPIWMVFWSLVVVVQGQTSLDAARGLLSQRLQDRQYAADPPVREAMDVMAKEGNPADWKLWAHCALFYNPATLGRDVPLQREMDLLVQYFPFFRACGSRNLSPNRPYYIDLAVALLVNFADTTDPFTKMHLASCYSMALHDGEAQTNQEIQASIAAGKVTREQVDEFLATAKFMGMTVAGWKPEEYGLIPEMHWVYWAGKNPDIPWIQAGLRDHTFPPQYKRALIEPWSSRKFPAARSVPLNAAAGRSAPRSKDALFDGYSWWWLSAIVLVLVAAIWWCARQSRSINQKPKITQDADEKHTPP